MKISSTRRDAIADNLMQKYAKGGNRRQKMTALDYRSRYDYCSLSEGYRTITAPAAEEDSFYRFNAEELFNCDWGDEWDAKSYVRSRFPSLGQSGITQRARRLVRRTKAARKHLQNAGTQGIYDLSYSSPYGADSDVYDRRVRVFANSKAEAESLATMMLDPYFMYAQDRSRSNLRIRFVEPGNMVESLSLFSEFKVKNDKLIAKAENEIVELQQKIASLQMQAEAVASVTTDAMDD